MTTCTLCDLPITGDPITDADVDGSFCCQGCKEVYRTLGDVDLEEREEARPDVETAVDANEEAETAFLSIDGMHCKSCEAFVETTANEHEGVYAASTSYATEMAKIAYDPDELSVDDLVDVVSKLGYRASVPGEVDEHVTESLSAVEQIRVVFGLAGMMSVMALYLFFIYPVFLGIYDKSFLYEFSTTIMVFAPLPMVSGFVLVVAGFPILRGAYASLRAGQPNMDVLVALAAITAYFYSLIQLALGQRLVYFDVTAMVIGIVTLGNYVESRIKRRALGQLSELTEQRVTEARVRRSTGSTRMTPVSDLTGGEHVVVKPGERVPTDGTVVDGTAAVDEALVTGEFVPHTKRVGDSVLGGTVVTDNPLVVEVADDVTSTMDRLINLLWNIQSDGGGFQQLAERIAVVFVPVVIALSVAVAIVDLALGAALTTAVTTGIAVLVVSCPCSLGLATPLAVAASVREAADRGVLVSNALALEELSEADIVAFDKTGTLTTGELTLVDAVGDETDRAITYAAAVESFVNHPVATAIERATDPADLPVNSVESFDRGVSGVVDGHDVVVGHPLAFDERGWTVDDAADAEVTSIRERGHIPVLVGWDGAVRAVLGLQDEPRDDWESVFETVAGAGAEVVIISGDDSSTISEFTDHPAVTDAFAGVPPEAKAEVVKRLRKRGSVAMIGDGTNDAPALAAADLGIALSTGTELAIEAADATVNDGRLEAITELFTLAKRTRRRIRQNLAWALLYNLIAIPLAIGGILTPLIASVAMASSSLIVVANSARSYLSDDDVTEIDPVGVDDSVGETSPSGTPDAASD